MITRNSRLRRVATRCLAPLAVFMLMITLWQPRRAAAQPSPALDGPARAISANPFLLLFGYFSGEVEQRLNRNFAGAIAGSYINFDSEHYSNLDAKIRFYPNEKALRGFGIAMSAGVTRIQYSQGLVCIPSGPSFNCPSETRTATSPSVAIELGYQWLLGTKQHTAITIGGGVKRFLETTHLGETSVAVPTGRLTIGYAW